MPGPYYDRNGNKVNLGKELGSGGEATVYTVQGRQQECAKIYKNPTQDHSRKVVAMLKNAPADPTLPTGHRSLAWPLAVLYTDPQKNHLAGFTMPIADRSNFVSVLNCCDPGDRNKLFGGQFNWLYLSTVAQNISSAIAALHERGYCIGDINQNNILVASNTMVTLIDCDSFQVKDASGKTYPCPVGTQGYIPPEFLGRSLNLNNVERTPESDAFSMAVLIFQLLMEGNHPFRGVWKLAGDITLEEKIEKGYFPYGRTLKEIVPPPDVPPFEMLHKDIQKLFLRCFLSGHHSPKERPSANEWFETLRNTRSQITECSQNKNHRFFNHLNICPWLTVRPNLEVNPRLS